jgi:hypothetical protein
VEEVKRLPLLVISCAFLSMQGYACQETMVEYRIREKVVFLDGEGLTLRKASVIVREAFGSTTRRTRGGTPVGEVVRRGRTDRNGTFSLKGLRGASYWVTYDEQERSESFLLVRRTGDNEPVHLKIDNYPSYNLCYAVDVEHNTTKPPNWPQPIAMEHQD